MSGTPQKLLLLDSASLYFRAFYGVPDRRQHPADPPTNAIRGFADMIATLVSDHAPTDLVACWDNDWRPAFRVEALPTYKAHRVLDGTAGQEDSPELLTPQVPEIVELLEAVGITRLGIDECEADDVIGTLVTRYRDTAAIDVVTGDRDLFQLVDDEHSIRVLYTAKGGVRDPDVVNESYLQARYGISGGRAYADMAVLRGDPSDGLPGVPGIGEKTAATLINRYGDLGGLRRAVDEGDPQVKGAQRTRLEAASAYLDAAPRVVDVVRDAPVPEDLQTALPSRVADPDRLGALAARLPIRSPLARLLNVLGLD
ncbi:5'-3' exonuclease [Leekyejoonella antrihumi]|uniref:5'-3' exonuclease n=1 Tax=Leekyejoonella antrihumi TaxID=1660198 RepID=A0A563E2U3_9MICO|nr:5'-3' exonuclease [Leekyejoonella antrihumi]TWP36858.1 5'-3' exonuclease [Leekyejoonella antrihumi]